jgi:hypothetical protein
MIEGVFKEGFATAKCSAHIGTLAVLHEDQADHHNGRQHLNRQQRSN